jgi:formate dehydrogenase maturation protein FdhE
MSIEVVNEHPGLEEHEPVRFLHSACCGAHWEVVIKQDGTGRLQCERCGMGLAQSLVKVTHTIQFEGCMCDVCSSEGKRV